MHSYTCIHACNYGIGTNEHAPTNRLRCMSASSARLVSTLWEGGALCGEYVRMCIYVCIYVRIYAHIAYYMALFQKTSLHLQAAYTANTLHTYIHIHIHTCVVCMTAPRQYAANRRHVHAVNMCTHVFVFHKLRVCMCWYPCVCMYVCMRVSMLFSCVGCGSWKAIDSFMSVWNFVTNTRMYVCMYVFTAGKWYLPIMNTCKLIVSMGFRRYC